MNYFAELKRIAIVDDDPLAADEVSLQIQEAGFEPFVISSNTHEGFETMSDLLKIVKEKSDGVLCDHRLSPKGLANFSGASVAAELYDYKMPCVLITQFIEIDRDVSIRMWRQKIPSLIARENANAVVIKSGFEICLDELHGNIRKTRQPHRVLVRIEDTGDENQKRVFDAIIPGWNSKQAVRFPEDLIPENFRAQVGKGSRLFANVNIGARQQEDLFLTNFELAPNIKDVQEIA